MYRNCISMPNAGLMSGLRAEMADGKKQTVYGIISVSVYRREGISA